MAGDLIPPPSPAGRPEVPGDGSEKQQENTTEFRAGHELEEHVASSTPGASEVEPRIPTTDLGETADDELGLAVHSEGPKETPYRRRFRFQFGVLLGLAAIAVGATVMLVNKNDHHEGTATWSTWKPGIKSSFSSGSTDQYAAAQQIADHVSDKYRMDNGDQLVVAKAGPMEIADLPVDVVMRSAPNDGDLDFIEGNGVMFTLSGLGVNGSIEKGKPSADRHLLLRREALEMALYSFQYIKGVDHVVAILPPRPPDAEAADETSADSLQALFYRSGDLHPQLKRPLVSTIETKTPKPATLPKVEAKEIAGLTDKHLFNATFQQGQDARAYMVLDRVTAQ